VEGVTTRRRTSIAAAVVVVVVLGGCSGSSDSSGPKDSKRSSSTTTSTAPGPTTGSTPSSDWVGAWRASLGRDYGPAQQTFLAAVQGARVVEVQAATQQLLVGNAALRAAIDAAGPPPAADRKAARRLTRALELEHELVTEMQEVCTGSNPRCEEVVNRYVDNNSEQVIPALVALRA